MDQEEETQQEDDEIVEEDDDEMTSNLKMNLLPNFQHGLRILRAAARVCQKTD